MKYYADTGFLLSLHLQETTSAAAAAIMQTVTEPLPVTPLVALEFRNALRLAVFRQTITEPQRAAAWTSFGQDLRRGQTVDRPGNLRRQLHQFAPCVASIAVVTTEPAAALEPDALPGEGSGLASPAELCPRG
jgi:hypothetical protein